jgi:quercetin dioxygenase-like cupin family protein
MIYDVKNGEVVLDQGGCVGTRLYEAQGNEYVHLSISPGGAVPEHALPLAVSFCVLKGEGICSVSGADFTMTAGQMAECPPNEPRGWRNESDELLQVLVIKRQSI